VDCASGDSSVDSGSGCSTVAFESGNFKMLLRILNLDTHF
jgi:hypothetical protein